MNKKEFVDNIAAKAGLAKKDAESFLEAFVECVTDVLKNGDKIQLVGFGTFEVADRAERTCLNPQTKEPMTIPAKKSPRFKVGKLLKSAVEGEN